MNAPVRIGDRGVRQLSEMVRKASRLQVSQQTGRPRNNQSSQRLVVKLLSDIAAEDPEFYDAAVMDLVAGVWTDTGARVSIRNVSDRDFSTDDRVIVSQVSDLGFCIE